MKKIIKVNYSSTTDGTLAKTRYFDNWTKVNEFLNEFNRLMQTFGFVRDEQITEIGSGLIKKTITHSDGMSKFIRTAEEIWVE